MTTPADVAETLRRDLRDLRRHLDERLDRLEDQQAKIAKDVDAIDRFNRPHGDGTRDDRRPARRRRW